jgi:signal transduction histidine kinase
MAETVDLGGLTPGDARGALAPDGKLATPIRRRTRRLGLLRSSDRWHPHVVVLFAAVLAVILLGVFAEFIASSQARSKDDAQKRFLAQATIAAGLTKAIFTTSDGPQAAAAAKSFGTRQIASAKLEKLLAGGVSDAYVTDAQGRVLAGTAGSPHGVSAAAVAALHQSPTGSAWFSDLYRGPGGKYFLEEAIPFETAFGMRAQVAGLPAAELAGFLGSYLAGAIPEKVAHGFILDGHGRIVASSVKSVAVGQLTNPQFLHILTSTSASDPAQGSYNVATGPFQGSRYVVAAPIGGSHWRVGITEPTSALYPADVGSDWWVSWIVFVAFALAAGGCLLLLRRSLSGAEQLVCQARQVEVANTELEATNAELSAFSYSVSHDLRAPLRAIDGFSRIVIEDDDGTLTDEQRRYLGLVRENTQVMGTLIDDLLAFSRLANQPLSRRSVDTAALVGEIEGELALGGDVGRIEFTSGELPIVDADPVLSRQVFANLIGNAIKYSREAEAPQIFVGSELRDGERVFSVRDNGVGFDMRYAEKLFQVFQRLHRAEDYEGTGVGLAIVQRIITRHGGRVWADSEPGEGATFYFTLTQGAS